MAKLINLARMYSTTTGLGSITLGQAVAGHITFAAAGAVDGDIMSYSIIDGAAAEVGRGTYLAAGPTLTRDEVYNSTNSGAKIYLSGQNEQVLITALAQDFDFGTTITTTYYIDGLATPINTYGHSFVMPIDGTLDSVIIYAETTGTAGSTIVDVNKNGTTIFTTQANRPTLAYDDADKIDVADNPDVIMLVANDILTIDIDQVATGARNITIIIKINTITNNARGIRPQQAIWSYQGQIQTQNLNMRIYNDTTYGRTIKRVFASVNTAPTGAAIIVDVHKNGTTIFTTQANRPTIAAGTYTGSSTTINVPLWGFGEYLTVDIDQVGSAVPGNDLVVQVVSE